MKPSPPSIVASWLAIARDGCSWHAYGTLIPVWPRFVPVRFLIRFGLWGRFGSQVRFGSHGSPVRAVRRFARFGQWPKSSQGTKSEMFTKRVAVRAVELSISAFCAEFRCEQLCDDDIFSIGATFRIFHDKGRRESCGPLELSILRRISVRTTL